MNTDRLGTQRCEREGIEKASKQALRCHWTISLHANSNKITPTLSSSSSLLSTDQVSIIVTSSTSDSARRPLFTLSHSLPLLSLLACLREEDDDDDDDASEQRQHRVYKHPVFGKKKLLQHLRIPQGYLGQPFSLSSFDDS